MNILNLKANTWVLNDGRAITLLTPEELQVLPGHTKIISIDGETRLVIEPGAEPPDNDTRFGYTAWGLAPVE